MVTKTNVVQEFPDTPDTAVVPFHEEGIRQMDGLDYPDPFFELCASSG